MNGQEVDRFRIAGIAHIDNVHPAAGAGAEIGVPACHHHLHAVAPAVVIGVADEVDVAGCFGFHDVVVLLAD